MTMARAGSSSDSTSTPVTRQRKTPAERAQLDYDKAVKQRDAAQAKLTKAQESIDSLSAEVDMATRYVDYASRNPNLPAQSPGDEDASEPA
jgi:hypothetical protein